MFRDGCALRMTLSSLSDDGLQHTRPLCPSPSPAVCPSSCPLNKWYHPTISSSVASFSCCPQYLLAPGSLPMSQLFRPGGQSIGISASASKSVLPMSIQFWFPLQFSSVAQSCPALLRPHAWTVACQASLSFTNSRSLLKLMSIKSVILSNHFILCCPLFLLSSIFPSIRDFSNESVLHIRWPKYWSFSLSISPSNEYSGLISFMIDWLDLLAVQGTLKSLLQYYSSKTSIFWPSAFFTVQLEHPYMTTGKTIALTSWTFVGKVMSLLFNMLSRFVITFLPRSKRLLISWLQSPSAVILELPPPPK